MPSYNLSVLGLEVSFKAEADPQRVHSAKSLLEERFQKLNDGRQISREKLLTYLALSLADDLLQSNQEKQTMEQKIDRLLAKIDEAM